MVDKVLTLNELLDLMNKEVEDTVLVGIYSNKVSHDRVLYDEVSKYFDYLYFSEDSYYLDKAIWNRVYYVFKFSDIRFYGDFFISFEHNDSNKNLYAKPSRISEVLTDADCEGLRNVLLYDFGIHLSEDGREGILKFLSGEEDFQLWGYNFAIGEKRIILVHMGY